MIELCIFFGGVCLGVLFGMSIAVAAMQDGVKIKPLHRGLRFKLWRLFHRKQWREMRRRCRAIDEMQELPPPRCPTCGSVVTILRR